MRTIPSAVVSVAAFQSKIMCNGKNPAAKIPTRPTKAQVLEERQENLLRNFFRVFN
ncbi:MAG: hypothetical protein WBQ34_12440 [Candidatus Acidiferrales bacterium]